MGYNKNCWASGCTTKCCISPQNPNMHNLPPSPVDEATGTTLKGCYWLFICNFQCVKTFHFPKAINTSKISYKVHIPVTKTYILILPLASKVKSERCLHLLPSSTKNGLQKKSALSIFRTLWVQILKYVSWSWHLKWSSSISHMKWGGTAVCKGVCW